ncbi:MAG: diguanylate cyclase [Ectothiorhodospiraceae bacterium]|nr:diguanylate cyclase [Ectothiorhodospiraceae bacterium]
MGNKITNTDVRNDTRTNSSPGGLSINTLLVLCFVIVSLLPISILGFKVYDASWENAWREVREKHQSLAENLSAPLTNYIDDRHIALTLLAEQLSEVSDLENSQLTSPILEQSLKKLYRFQATFLLDNNLQVINHSSTYPVDLAEHPRFDLGKDAFLTAAFESTQQNSTENANRDTNKSNNKSLNNLNLVSLSPVVLNPYNGQTTILIALPILYDSRGNVTRLLVGELKKSVIEKMRASIHFGKQGHSAMVDQLGRVIAHPNADWMNDDIKNISNLHIIQAMMAGNTGVTGFYSPFTNTDMVAGFTAIPKYGWGIMVPQPKHEIEEQVARVLRAELIWALAGLLFTVIIGFSLAAWITHPINRLVKAGHGLRENNYENRLPRTHRSAPKEIQQLSRVFGGAVNRLITSRQELDTLNQSLQQRVDEATTELRSANKKLEELATSDHLTKLANRRHFEDTIADLADRRQKDSLGNDQTVCLLLIDIDKFKVINDQHGHPAGDAVLVQIGEILQKSLRKTDIAARYAGDEFVILLRTNIETGRVRAQELRESIARHRFTYQGQDLHATVSIGLTSCETITECGGIEEVLRQVDNAMYEAKRLGRNRIAEATLINIK